MTAVTLSGVRLISEANVRQHWAARAKRVRGQRATVLLVLRATSGSRWLHVDLPVVVTLTRIAPRRLDSHDNLRVACKAIVDGVAEYLGLDDGDPRIEWRYEQERGAPRTYAVRIEITTKA